MGRAPQPWRGSTESGRTLTPKQAIATALAVAAGCPARLWSLRAVDCNLQRTPATQQSNDHRTTDCHYDPIAFVGP